MDVRPATAADDGDIRRLLRDNPLEGAVRLGFEREPDSALAAGVAGDEHQQVIVRESPGGALMGMGARSLLDAWVNGRPARLGYLSQLRADRRFRGSPRAIMRAYDRIRSLRADGPAACDISTIVEDNVPARRLLEAGLPSLPRYRRVARIVTFVLRARRTRRAPPPGWTVERGSPALLDGIVTCLERHGRRHQFAPRWTRAVLESPRRCRGLAPADFLVARRGERVAACAAVWDQRAFKQTVVRGYARGFALARPLWNLVPAAWGGVPLPAVGSPLRAAFLSHVAVDDDDPAGLSLLVDRALGVAAERGLEQLVTGFCDRHPHAATLARGFPSRRYTSLVYVVQWEDGDGEPLDGRVPHLEVAIL